MNNVYENLTENQKSFVRSNVEWMRSEEISPISLEANIPNFGLATITINGSVFKKEV